MRRVLSKVETEVLSHIQPIPGRMVVLMANGTVDAQYLAQHECENRGMGTGGRWVGFPEAAKEWDEFRKKKADAATPKKLATLTPAENKVWTDAFDFVMGMGKTEHQADLYAWLEVCGKFPRLRTYDGAQP